MPGLQSSNVEETVPPDCWEEKAQGVADVVAAVMTALGLACLMSGASRCYFSLCDVPLPERFITDHPTLVIGIPCAVLAVALCIKKRRATSRTGVSGDNENGGVAKVLDDFFEACHGSGSVSSDGGDEHWVVQPPIPLLLVVSIPSSSSSRTAGGVSAGSGVVTAADVELGGASHHRRGERERGVDMSGEAVRDGRGKKA